MVGDWGWLVKRNQELEDLQTQQKEAKAEKEIESNSAEL